MDKKECQGIETISGEIKRSLKKLKEYLKGRKIF